MLFAENPHWCNHLLRSHVLDTQPLTSPKKTFAPSLGNRSYHLISCNQCPQQAFAQSRQHHRREEYSLSKHKMSGVEVVGLVAAAGQFIEQTIKIVKLIQEVRSKWGDGPAEVQQWMQEMETIKGIVGKVQQISALQTPEIAAILSRAKRTLAASAQR